MTYKAKEAILKYSQLRDEIDTRCTQLHEMHQEHTQCKRGCSDCCMNFSVLPVEFHAILSEIKAHFKGELTPTNNEACLFLVDHACTIYENRPIICRSHGLPILFMDNAGENFNLSFCPLNFRKADDDYFSIESSYEQDLYNSKLYQINKAFIEAYEEVKYSENQMIELSKLKGFKRNSTAP